MANSVTFIGGIADKQFKDWQKNNEDSFYLNVIGKFAMIHKANCWHLGDGAGMAVPGILKFARTIRKI